MSHQKVIAEVRTILDGEKFAYRDQHLQTYLVGQMYYFEEKGRPLIPTKLARRYKDRVYAELDAQETGRWQ